MASVESQAMRQMLLRQREAARGAAPPSVEEQRRQLDAMGGLLPLAPDVVVRPAESGGVPGEWIDAPGARADRVLLYLHGGAYSMGGPASHRSLVARLARAAAARGLLVDYRLAPEHRFPAAVEDAVAAYRGLLAAGLEPGRIVLAGDSAGGGLAVATLVALREAGQPLPAGAALLSPWTDLAGTGETLRTRAERDPWIDPSGIGGAARLYLGEEDPRHPLASPLYAELGGLPPLLIHVGEDEVLLDDARRLAERARAAGVEVTLRVWPEMWHVFQAFPMPEAEEAIAEIGRFVQARTP
ncbi:MAG: alpha/beta hydrolase [Clostridia bacterium]|nr:alpha/beta hydrolase [Clostridia bacterium]